MQKQQPLMMDFSPLGRPYPGETVSGDAWFIRQSSDFTLFALIDVLGHGLEAHEVAVQLLNILADVYKRPLLEIVRICHEKLRYTRGSAMAIALIDFSRQSFEHISIGNVETRVYGTPEPIQPFCLNGTLGMAMESQKVTKYPFPAGGTIIMFSDGINGKFDIEPKLLEQSPQVIASYIFNNFAQNCDDATVLVGRLTSA